LGFRYTGCCALSKDEEEVFGVLLTSAVGIPATPWTNFIYQQLRLSAFGKPKLVCKFLQYHAEGGTVRENTYFQPEEVRDG
jgi:hypothetical protein